MVINTLRAHSRYTSQSENLFFFVLLIEKQEKREQEWRKEVDDFSFILQQVFFML